MEGHFPHFIVSCSRSVTRCPIYNPFSPQSFGTETFGSSEFNRLPGTAPEAGASELVQVLAVCLEAPVWRGEGTRPPPRLPRGEPVVGLGAQCEGLGGCKVPIWW